MSNKFRASLAKTNSPTSAIGENPYQLFTQLDGQHPWMQQMPDGYVSYSVRELRAGDVTYFNFALAKEMGLIPAHHPNTMSNSLRQVLLSTFSLRIINEFDLEKERSFDPTTIKPNKYMATRYLQLQHSDKRGLRSGDGRCIWNGTVTHKGTTWDVSSRGTGVTCLSPGAAEAERHLETGSHDFGYGCGLAEIDELYGAAISAEVMHLQGITTERVLAIIDFGDGTGIGVRAGTNLLRPAHLFRYLKQDRRADLKAGTDYHLQRELHNKALKISPGQEPYSTLANHLAESFATFAAKLEVDYIFAWLDWDGDNVLMIGGIIDYGSIRQFGLRHDRYRYDDVERFSTSLTEQKSKAQLTVQVFAQMFDYLKTGRRKPLKAFRNHLLVKKFKQDFNRALFDRMLYRCGFDSSQRQELLQHTQLLQNFYREFSYFERAKIQGKCKKVADGINHPALFNMRSAITEIAQNCSKNGPHGKTIPAPKLFQSMLSSFTKARDRKFLPQHHKHLEALQLHYAQLVQAVTSTNNWPKVTAAIASRAQQLNQQPRLTGNALIQIVNELVAELKSGLAKSEVQKVIDQLIGLHLQLPEGPTREHHWHRPRLLQKTDLIARFMKILADRNEDI